jgi:hypothetical protein
MAAVIELHDAGTAVLEALREVPFPEIKGLVNV